MVGVILPLPFILFAQTPNGLFTTFESFIDLEKDKFVKKLEKLKANPDKLKDLKDISTVDLDPSFLNHLLFYTPTRYAILGQKDKCSFYDLVMANLVKDYQGPIDYFIIRYTPVKGRPRRSYVTKETFMNIVAVKQCENVFKFQSYFDTKNFSKTIKTINLQTPQTYNQCLTLHQGFIKDYKTPYLCSIYEKIYSLPTLEKDLRNTPSKDLKSIKYLKNEIKGISFYKKLLNNKAFDYLQSLCSHLDQPKVFCNNFFRRDFWEKVLQKEKSFYYAKSLCQSILDRKELSKVSIENCIRKLNANPDICRYANTYSPGITPMPNCKNIANALNFSRLYADYDDCPAKTGNEALVNSTRIIEHLTRPKHNSGTLCSHPPIDQFVRFNEENDGRAWQVFLCYDDKINEEEVCFPSLTGDVENSDLSIGKVVSRILQKTRAASTKLKCSLVDQKEYNPVILKYSSGCWITYDPKDCSAISCPNKIIFNEKEITHIKQKQKVEFDYFPINFSKAQLAFTNILKKGLQITHKKIINTTTLKTVFKNHPKAIIHGIGCSEDLLPSYFKKYAFNQCTPLPFIVDGFIEDNGSIALITRTAVDNLHAPRIINWTKIFSAIKSYQLQHPLNQWGLYGIY